MTGFDQKMNEQDYDLVTAPALKIMASRKAYPDVIDNCRASIETGNSPQEAALTALMALCAHQEELEEAILRLAQDLHQRRGVSLRTLSEATGLSPMTLKRKFDTNS